MRVKNSKMEENMKISELIRAKGYEIGEFEKELGVSIGYLSRFNGINKLPFEKVCKIATMLDMTITNLIQRLESVKIDVEISKEAYNVLKAQDYSKSGYSDELLSEIKQMFAKIDTDNRQKENNNAV